MIVMLPTPPSVNAMYKNARRGRVKTDAYKDWITEAGYCYNTQKKRGPDIEGPYRVEIHLPKNVRGDIDNRQKAVLDFLVMVGATPDDKHCQSVMATRGEDNEYYARIVVEAA
jgi:Holliday junction resolvase RusA-like endonuclease